MHVLVARLRLNLFNDDGDIVHIFFYSIRYFTSLFKFYTVPWFIPEDCLHITLGSSIRFSNSYVCFFAVCPDGSRPVNCFANPCDVSNGCYNIPMASCRYDIISFFYLCTKTLWKQTVKLQSVTFSIDYAKYLISIQ